MASRNQAFGSGSNVNNGDALVGNNHANPDAVRPIPIYKKGSPEREAAVGFMADNVKQTYAHANDHSQFAGETFYSHDAHGAAHAIAAGHNPDAAMGQMLRRTGGKTQETWGHDDVHELFGNRPEYAGPAHAAVDFVSQNRGHAPSDDQRAAAAELASKQRASRRAEKGTSAPETWRAPDKQAELDQTQAAIPERVRRAQETASNFEAIKQTSEHGTRLERAAGVLARLSPQTPWHDNVSQAWEVTQHPHFNELAHGLNPATNAQRTEAESAVIGKTETPASFGKPEKKSKLHYNTNANIAHAARIWSGEETSDENIDTPDGNERGRVKIGTFYHNILHPRTSELATVDFRASDVARGQTLNTQGPKYDENGPRKSAVDQRGMGAKGRYDMMEQAHIRAAHAINEDPETDKQRIGANPIRPHQVQGVTWFVESNRTGDYLESSASHRGQDIKKGQGVRKAGRKRADMQYPAGQGPADPEFGKYRDPERRW